LSAGAAGEGGRHEDEDEGVEEGEEGRKKKRKAGKNKPLRTSSVGKEARTASRKG
jgi:hypothetical protein